MKELMSKIMDAIKPTRRRICYRYEEPGHVKKNCRVVLLAASRNQGHRYDFKIQHRPGRHHNNGGAGSYRRVEWRKGTII